MRPGQVNLDVVTHGFDVELRTKAAIAAGNTLDAVWAKPLTAPAALIQDFIGYMNPQTIIGRLPGVTKAPFNVPVPIVSTGARLPGRGKTRPNR